MKSPDETRWQPGRPQRAALTPAALLLAATALLLPGCTDPSTQAMPESDSPVARSEPPAFYLGGIQVNEADHEAWFDNLRAQSMNTVQVTEYAKQGDWDSDHMWWDEEAPWVLEEIRGAKRRGLSVVFVCRVALDHAFERNEFLWHGMILPKTEELIDSWFAQYGRFVVERAEIAEREGVDVFMIGSEMNALATTLPAAAPPNLEEYFLNEEKQEDRREQVLAQEQLIAERHLELPERHGYGSVESYIDARIAKERQWAESATAGDVEDLPAINRRRARLKQHWEALIAEVRKVYSGPIGYAANFDHYHHVGFWPSLDVMGINAYFELRDRVLPDESEEHLYPLLVDGWRRVLGGIADFRAGQDLGEQPVIFTEIGFTQRAKSTLRPWADEGFTLIYNPTVEADGIPGQTEEYVVAWRDEPIKLEERAWAVRALWQAHSELERPFLKGILYWKLSSHDYHLDDEAFMVHIGPGSEDPILPELRRFLTPPGVGPHPG